MLKAAAAPLKRKPGEELLSWWLRANFALAGGDEAPSQRESPLTSTLSPQSGERGNRSNGK
jgi:hypothetical protein